MYKERFADRHIGLSEDERQEMLKDLGLKSVDELIDLTIPAGIRLKKDLNLQKAQSEVEFLSNLKKIAAKNKVFKNYIGMGYYDTHTPKVILRNILENPGWYTQYTPYQAEIAQGRLEALLNYQSMIIDLTGMEIANASLLDEATAAAEAMTMLFSAKPKANGNKFLVSDKAFPQTIDVLYTRANPLDIEIVLGDPLNTEIDDSYFGVYVQYPDGYGTIQDYEAFCEHCAHSQVKVAVGSDLLALSLLKPPGEWGAEVVIGSTQRFGVPLGFGGPHAAFFATKEEHKRRIPGRIIGVSIDSNGHPAYRMALQTREQHIKRDRATSNICTSQVLLAVIAGMYAVYHGPERIKSIAEKVNQLTSNLALNLEKLGYSRLNDSFFDTLCINVTGAEANHIREVAEANQINLRYEDGYVGISIDETSEQTQIDHLISIFAEAKDVKHKHVAGSKLSWDKVLTRTSAFMQHEIFNTFHTEHEMLRYMKSLENKDLSLTHSMIALGSCTMKLNATTEMIPVTWESFGSMHPFAPANQAEGYLEIIEDLSSDLAEITGFDKVSIQPNAGAQGEFTGLMVIREYFRSKGEDHRNVAIIPESAHGTNPASAVMAGMMVIVVKCLENGYIDLDDLRTKAELNKDNLAALMVTYPSTNGVFEEDIKDITKIIHDCGGQVYMDGANMNAQVGYTNPANIGADVCHLNLHKTFCIPHGGGGPGVGPIGVAKHLSPFLPGHSVVKTGGDQAMTAVSAAPFGSASILLISYAYIKMMGALGLKEATATAILNANYMKHKLDAGFQLLYSGANGTVAHEMIVDPRGFKATANIQVEDIAKRLMDYGFHAPTISFPVPGTMMIEPTESESKSEMDRFCEALLSIRNEIFEIEEGLADQNDNVLKNAPHTADSLMSDKWNRPYSREKAAYPLHFVKMHKFWPSVGRVDNTYGDRNLVCSCLPLEAYVAEPAVS